jgi:hypothetical protein
LSAKRAAVSAEIDSLAQTQSLRPAERDAILDFKDKLRLTRWPDYLDELMARLPAMSGPPSVLANEVKPDSPG